MISTHGLRQLRTSEPDYPEHDHIHRTNEGEQNGCRQRLGGCLSCIQSPPLAVARSETLGSSSRLLE